MKKIPTLISLFPALFIIMFLFESPVYSADRQQVLRREWCRKLATACVSKVKSKQYARNIRLGDHLPDLCNILDIEFDDSIFIKKVEEVTWEPFLIGDIPLDVQYKKAIEAKKSPNGTLRFPKYYATDSPILDTLKCSGILEQLIRAYKHNYPSGNYMDMDLEAQALNACFITVHTALGSLDKLEARALSPDSTVGELKGYWNKFSEWSKNVNQVCEGVPDRDLKGIGLEFSYDRLLGFYRSGGGMVSPAAENKIKQIFDRPLTSEERRKLEDRKAQLFLEGTSIYNPPTEKRKKEIMSEMDAIDQRLKMP